jgi:hypothetical protein
MVPSVSLINAQLLLVAPGASHTVVEIPPVARADNQSQFDAIIGA